MISCTVSCSDEGVMKQLNSPASAWVRLMSLREKFFLRYFSGKVSTLFLYRGSCSATETLPLTISYTVLLSLSLQCTLVSWSLWSCSAEEHGRTTEPPITPFTVACRETEITEKNECLHEQFVAWMYLSNVVCSDTHLYLSVLQTYRWTSICRNRKSSLFP